jgi:hypothetical protein
MEKIKTIKQPEMKNLADFLHNAFRDDGKLFCAGTIPGWLFSWFLVFGEFNFQSVIKIAMVLIGAASTGFATVAGKDFWVYVIRPKIFKHKKENKNNNL